MDEKRSCYSCEHAPLCFLKARVKDAIKLPEAWPLCICVGQGAPRVWTDLFDTLAEVCTEFKPRLKLRAEEREST